MSNYVLSVGLEVHAELETKSKMFCRCAVAFGGEPNTRVCPVCLGMPGALPVPNREAVMMVLRTALALNCTIAKDSIFHRKNYFYPDLSKGYQISQYGDTNPIGYNGYLDIPSAGGSKRIKIRRVHLEEDTGKLMHIPGSGSGIDYNRSGVPLMEIVTDFPPDVDNADDAKEYLVQLRQLLIFLGVCNGKMAEGSMRCEPNISVRLEGAEKFGTKTELKNLNSFRSVQLGVEFERRRQIAVLEQGGQVLQETRGWNEGSEASYVMRIKESENDYRYFPDPDLVPMHFSDELIEEERRNLPELPLAKQQRYQAEFGLSAYDAGVLVAEKEWAEYFETCVRLGGEPKAVCNWMNGEFARMLNESGQTVNPHSDREKSKVTPEMILELIGLIQKGTISGNIGKQVFVEMFEKGSKPGDVVQAMGLTQISDDSAIEKIVREVIAENAAVVEKFRAGQENVFGFLVGQSMKKTQGRANPQMVQEIMRNVLGEQ